MGVQNVCPKCVSKMCVQNGCPKWVSKFGVPKVQKKTQKKVQKSSKKSSKKFKKKFEKKFEIFLLKITNCWREGREGRVENCHSNALMAAGNNNIDKVMHST
jgi:hypothetical protein